VRHARFRPVRWAANRPASTVQVDFEAEAGLLGFSGQGQLRIFGPSNEKYAIRGGCDQLPTRLSAQLQGQIELGQQLVAVRQGGGTVTLDKVVLAVPFSILRSSVDFSGAGFRPLKQTAIRELGMGTNSKLHVQFTDRHWEGLGCNGETFADTGYQNTWDESGQRAAQELLSA
jgi:monoamine oxidase